jgi:hypothetical protein
MAATNPPTTENPLAGFVRLSRTIYLREPVLQQVVSETTPPLAADNDSNSDDDDNDDDNTPSTIILSFWFSASPRALVKYVAEYARLAPSARIIFLLSTPRDFYFYPNAWAHRRRLMPAVKAIHKSIIRSTTTTTNGGKEKRSNPVFMHIFSNGGVFTTAHLLLAYRHFTGGEEEEAMPMPISAMIIDSAPGRSTFSRSAKALSYALPPPGGRRGWLARIFLRPVGMGIIYFALMVSWLWRRIITRSEDSLAWTRSALIDPRLVVGGGGGSRSDAKKGTKRCYIYSDTDDLIPAEEVEQHAAESEAEGWPVERHKFLGSPHVGHMRADPERYWGIVRRYLRGGVGEVAAPADRLS